MSDPVHVKSGVPQQGLIQKEKLGIDGEKSFHISNVAKKTNTKVTPDYDYRTQTSYTLQMFCFFCY